MVEWPLRKSSLLLSGTWEAMPALLPSADFSQSRWDWFSRSSGKHSEPESGAVEVEQRLEVEEVALTWVEEDGLS